MKYRLRWDNLYTDWQEAPDQFFAKADEGVPLLLRVDPPTEWRFNLQMLNQLDGQVAVDATLIVMEFQK